MPEVMNVTTTGFPFASSAGTPAQGGAGQGFALALGAVAGFGRPVVATLTSQGEAAKLPIMPAAKAVDAGALVRVQPDFTVSAMSISQLLAAASKLPAAEIKAPGAVPVNGAASSAAGDVTASPVSLAAGTVTAQPAQSAADNVLPEVPVKAPASVTPAEAAAQPAPVLSTPVVSAPPEGPEAEATAKPDTDTAVLAETPAPAIFKLPESMVVLANTNAPLPLPVATDDQPGELSPPDLPATPAPAHEIVPSGTLATPVKARKPLAIDLDQPPLPVEPLVAQPVATPTVAPAPVAQPAQPMAASERKPEASRGAKTAPVAMSPADAPIVPDSQLPDKIADIADSAKDGRSFADAAPPAETAKADLAAKATPAASQSFTAHLTPASAPARAPAPAATVAEPMIPAHAGQIGHAMGVEIARKVEAGEDTLRVRLNPVELGRVEVTLAFDDNGSLRATMRAESRHALELLRQDAPDLGRALDQAGIRADVQSFRFESRSDGNGGASGQSGQQQSRGGNSHQSFNDEPETSAPAYRAIRNDGQVDLLA